MKTIEFTLAGALRYMLDESGQHQDELAERADISKGSITNYSRGRTRPRWSTVERWATACGFDADDPQLRRLWETWRPRQDSNLRPRDYRCAGQLTMLDGDGEPTIAVRQIMSRSAQTNHPRTAIAC